MLTRLNFLLKPRVKPSRCFSTQPNDEISPILTNRNPRNLERLRIGYKPDGYHLDKKGKHFWHKLRLTANSRHVTATLVHFENGVVVKASTEEWALKKQLYRYTDASAYINLARVFAQRCLQSGIVEIYNDLETANKEKLALFVERLEKDGVALKEPEMFKKAQPWDLERPEKPWEITE